MPSPPQRRCQLDAFSIAVQAVWVPVVEERAYGLRHVHASDRRPSAAAPTSLSLCSLQSLNWLEPRLLQPLPPRRSGGVRKRKQAEILRNVLLICCESRQRPSILLTMFKLRYYSRRILFCVSVLINKTVVSTPAAGEWTRSASKRKPLKNQTDC